MLRRSTNKNAHLRAPQIVRAPTAQAPRDIVQNIRVVVQHRDIKIRRAHTAHTDTGADGRAACAGNVVPQRGGVRECGVFVGQAGEVGRGECVAGGGQRDAVSVLQCIWGMRGWVAVGGWVGRCEEGAAQGKPYTERERGKLLTLGGPFLVPVPTEYGVFDVNVP